MVGAYGVGVAGWRNVRASAILFDYLKLAKYRLSGLVAFTAGAGYIVRADRDENGRAGPKFWRETCATTIGTYLTAASANTLNQIYEIRSDALMGRTRLRPLPAGRVSIVQAGVFALATAVTGLSILLQETNKTAASIAAANLVLYAGVYTPLKAISTVNTWVGAVVGALPPMLGWAAASGGPLSGDRERGAWVLGSILFLWQIPHFHALAVVSRSDYAAGKLRMLAVSNPVANAAWSRVTAAMLIPTGFVFAGCDATSNLFGWESALLGTWMYRRATFLAQSPTSLSAARALFRVSIMHLPITLTLMLMHRTSPMESQLAQERSHIFEVIVPRAGDFKSFSSTVIYHPWQTLAPFPFLPLPVVIPATVVPEEKDST